MRYRIEVSLKKGVRPGDEQDFRLAGETDDVALAFFAYNQIFNARFPGQYMFRDGIKIYLDGTEINEEQLREQYISFRTKESVSGSS